MWDNIDESIVLSFPFFSMKTKNSLPLYNIWHVQKMNNYCLNALLPDEKSKEKKRKYTYLKISP